MPILLQKTQKERRRALITGPLECLQCSRLMSATAATMRRLCCLASKANPLDLSRFRLWKSWLHVQAMIAGQDVSLPSGASALSLVCSQEPTLRGVFGEEPTSDPLIPPRC